MLSAQTPKHKSRTVFIFILCCTGMISWASAAEKGWREHKTMHFIISFKNAPEDVIEQIGWQAEGVFAEISDNMGLDRYPSWRSDQRLKILVYDDQEDYRASNNKIEH